MNAKQAVFEILNETPNGKQFTGIQLQRKVRRLTGKQLYPATALRHMRSYRNETRSERNQCK